MIRANESDEAGVEWSGSAKDALYHFEFGGENKISHFHENNTII